MPTNPTYTQEQKDALAARLRLFRENFPMPFKARCSQDDIAKVLKISRSNYTYFEQGRTIPNIFLLQKLADFYDVTVDELIGKDTNKTR